MLCVNLCNGAHGAAAGVNTDSPGGGGGGTRGLEAGRAGLEG